MIYKTCPICGAALDPGERCDCNEYQKPAIAPRYAETYGNSPPCCGANKKPPRALAAPRAARRNRF